MFPSLLVLTILGSGASDASCSLDMLDTRVGWSSASGRSEKTAKTHPTLHRVDVQWWNVGLGGVDCHRIALHLGDGETLQAFSGRVRRADGTELKLKKDRLLPGRAGASPVVQIPELRSGDRVQLTVETVVHDDLLRWRPGAAGAVARASLQINTGTGPALEASAWRAGEPEALGTPVPVKSGEGWIWVEEAPGAGERAGPAWAGLEVLVHGEKITGPSLSREARSLPSEGSFQVVGAEWIAPPLRVVAHRSEGAMLGPAEVLARGWGDAREVSVAVEALGRGAGETVEAAVVLHPLDEGWPMGGVQWTESAVLRTQGEAVTVAWTSRTAGLGGATVIGARTGTVLHIAEPSPALSSPLAIWHGIVAGQSPGAGLKGVEIQELATAGGDGASWQVEVVDGHLRLGDLWGVTLAMPPEQDGLRRTRWWSGEGSGGEWLVEIAHDGAGGAGVVRSGAAAGLTWSMRCLDRPKHLLCHFEMDLAGGWVAPGQVAGRVDAAEALAMVLDHRVMVAP